jgi:drug/metabolite transporter (DMT)-like permease
LTTRDLVALILLGWLWGASFLFIRVAVPVLGPLPLVELRVALAVVALLVYGAIIGRLPKLRAHWRRFLILRLVNSAIPFPLIAFAEIELTASLAAILNVTSVLFTAVVAAV